MTDADSCRADALDRYLDSLVTGDATGAARPSDGLDPELAQIVRALRSDTDAAPDPWFAARLRENLLMDATSSFTLPTLAPSLAPPAAASADPVRIVHTAARHALRRRAGLSAPGTATLPAQSVRPAPPRVPKPPTLLQHWNRRGWPILEFVAAAALIIGLVTAVTGNLPGGNGTNHQPTSLPGYASQTSQFAAATATPTPPEDRGVMSGGFAANDGQMPGPGLRDTPSVLWRIPTSQNAYSMVEGDGVVAWVEPKGDVLSDTGTGYVIHAISSTAGGVVWDVGISTVPALAVNGQTLIASIRSAPNEPPASIGDVQIGDGKQSVIASLDLKTGKLGWFSQIPGRAVLGAVDGGQGFVTSNDGTLHVIDLATGKEVWSQHLVQPLDLNTETGTLATLAVSKDMLVVYSQQEGNLYALNRDDGTTLWTTPVTDPTAKLGNDGEVYGQGTVTVSGPTIAGDAVLVTRSDYQNGGKQELLSLDLKTGQTSWTAELTPTVNGVAHPPYLPSDPRVGGGVVFLVAPVNENYGLIAFDPATGKQKWTVDLGETGYTSASVTGDTAYLARPAGQLTAVDLADKGNELWSVQTGGALRTSPFVRDGVIYQTGTDGYIYALSGNAAPAPASDSTPNISGQPTCDVTPVPAQSTHTTPYATPDAMATPAQTFEGINPDYPGVETMAWSNLPVGTPADAETVAGIQETVDGMTACARVGNLGGVAAYYTPDYSLRPGPASALWYSGYPMVSSEVPVMSRDLRVLPDGRVGMVVTDGLISREIGQNEGRLYLFAQQPDGRWLIDEIVILNDSGNPPQG